MKTTQELKTEIRQFYRMLESLPMNKTVSLEECQRLDELKAELKKRGA